MIQQHSLCQLHAIFLRFAVEIPVSQINTIDQVNIEELLLMWRWTPTNVIFNIPNVTFEQIGNKKPTNIRRDKKCPIEKQQGRQTVVDIHCAPLPPPGGGHVRTESVGSPSPLVARSIELFMLYLWCLNHYLNIDLKKKSDTKSYLNRI